MGSCLLTGKFNILVRGDGISLHSSSYVYWKFILFKITGIKYKLLVVYAEEMSENF